MTNSNTTFENIVNQHICDFEEKNKILDRLLLQISQAIAKICFDNQQDLVAIKNFEQTKSIVISIEDYDFYLFKFILHATKIYPITVRRRDGHQKICSDYLSLQELMKEFLAEEYIGILFRRIRTLFLENSLNATQLKQISTDLVFQRGQAYDDQLNYKKKSPEYYAIDDFGF